MLPQPGLKVVRYASPGCITGASPGYEPGLVELCVLVQCDMDMRHKGWLDLWHGFRHKKCNPEWLRHRLFSLSCTACDVLCSLHTGGMVIASLEFVYGMDFRYVLLHLSKAWSLASPLHGWFDYIASAKRKMVTKYQSYFAQKERACMDAQYLRCILLGYGCVGRAIRQIFLPPAC